jgi:hypothetical protein
MSADVVVLASVWHHASEPGRESPKVALIILVDQPSPGMRPPWRQLAYRHNHGRIVPLGVSKTPIALQAIDEM